MKIKDKVVIVTGAATGIGRGLCQRFKREGARAIVVADLDGAGAAAVAREVGGIAVKTDVASEAQVTQLVETATAKYGAIDLFCSNAGIMVRGGPEASIAEWQKIWDINVMAHVHAARAVLPGMLARGEGYLLQTASAAGLLSQIGSAPYAVTKHAAVGFAEWLSIAYGDRGIKVSCLCPQGVRTNMLLGDSGDRQSFLSAGSVSTEEVAECVIRGLDAEAFLILPHPEVLDYYRRKGSDYDRWIKGMRRLQAKVKASFGD
ncbi:MAG: short-chain dehydrogenase [Candidatus Muproteobacteria bacterium RBG_16_60_9]|uniref:Short-chain dehydrogenase n=1 Tax=Candidatus Muproteobacteria bacterium RBG_16_60_9 TaxID=1817755 RepID=A0A1F6VB85_9PROT|nr:MAG: short-chain dehydrogenase [Candidatus Muproteobacteria bacterium RBG_16_60_9]